MDCPLCAKPITTPPTDTCVLLLPGGIVRAVHTECFDRHRLRYSHREGQQQYRRRCTRCGRLLYAEHSRPGEGGILCHDGQPATWS